MDESLAVQHGNLWVERSGTLIEVRGGVGYCSPVYRVVTVEVPLVLCDLAGAGSRGIKCDV